MEGQSEEIEVKHVESEEQYPQIIGERVKRKGKVGAIVASVVILLISIACIIVSTLNITGYVIIYVGIIFLILGIFGLVFAIIDFLKGSKVKDKPCIVSEDESTLLFYLLNGKEEKIDVRDIQKVTFRARITVTSTGFATVTTTHTDGTIIFEVNDPMAKKGKRKIKVGGVEQGNAVANYLRGMVKSKSVNL